MEGMNTVQTREVSLGGTDVQAKKDYYSEKDGRKFVIPFFDDEYEGAKTSQGGRSIDKKVPPMQEEVDKLENENATKLHEMIKKRAQYLTESTRSAKSKWHHRGLMELELRQLKKEYFKE